jgi:hypothetical protein
VFLISSAHRLCVLITIYISLRYLMRHYNPTLFTLFITIPQGSPLFAATYLSDLSLSMACHPSLGVIIGLTHNLAPSTRGRFGGHLRDLTQWKEIAFLLFLRLKSYLTQIKRKRKYENKDSSAQVRELFVAFILCNFLCFFAVIF